MAADAFAMLDTSTTTCPSPGPHPRCSFPDGGDDWPVGLAVTADFTHYPHDGRPVFCVSIGALRSALRTRADLALENLALRQQLANLRRTSGRPRLRRIDRAFWLALSRLLTAAEFAIPTGGSDPAEADTWSCAAKLRELCPSMFRVGPLSFGSKTSRGAPGILPLRLPLAGMTRGTG